MIAAFVLIATSMMQSDRLGMEPAKFESAKYGVSFRYPSAWKTDISKPTTSTPSGMFNKRPAHPDLLLLRIESSSGPLSVIELRVSPGAKSDLTELVKGHPAWWKNPYSLDSAGTSVDAFWRGDADPTMVDNHRALVTLSSTMSLDRRSPAMDVLQLDFEGANGKVFRLLAGCTNPSYAPGKNNFERTKMSLEDSKAQLHKQRALLREILKTITVK